MLRSRSWIPQIALFLIAAGMVCVAQQPAMPGAQGGQAARSGQQEATKPNAQSEPLQPLAPLYQQEQDPSLVKADEMVPDTQPVSGVLSLTLGRLTQKNVIATHFQVSQIFDSNQSVTGPNVNFDGATSFGGSMHLTRMTDHGGLNLNYQAGGVIYHGSANMSWYPQLDISQAFKIQRWTLVFADRVDYTPEGSLAGGLAFQTYGASSLGTLVSPVLQPNQGVYTPLASRVSNSVSGQVEYGLSPRSSVTASASYGLLYFPDGTFGNNRQIDLRGGYNRALTAHDSISVFYDFGRYMPPQSLNSVDTHSVQLAYARRVTGRLTWSVAGGPQIYTTGSLSGSKASWTASTNGQYQALRTSLSFGYYHSVSGGSGVFDETIGDSLQVGVTRMLSQKWSAGTSGSIARNSMLMGSSEFKSGTVGVQAQRSLGQRMGMYFTYAFQRQLSSGACSGLLCTGFTRHVVGFGFNFDPRPWVMQ